ncbi:Ig-like domain-containing protein [candidate division KSB1 bacterium]|nr:Ig-like domain-containing protein [candidate division KSB1 bacterium]
MARSKRFFSSTVEGLLLILLAVLLTASHSYGQITIMPLGDSITRGVGSTNENGYRKPLYNLLNGETGTYGFTFDFVGSLSDGDFADTDHEGHNGYQSNQLNSEIQTYLANAGHPDIVILHLGTNDINNARDLDATVADMESSIEQIGKTTTFLLCSLVPRYDNTALDDSTTVLNNKLKIMYYRKLNQGYDLYYVGINEVFKTKTNWNSSSYFDADKVHPNDGGYNLMAGVIFNVLMNAINETPKIVTDNFNRTDLGSTWAVDNGTFDINTNELRDASGVDDWHMAVFLGIKDAFQTEIRWSTSANQAGITQGGLLMGLTGPTTSANGYFIWVHPSNKIMLYNIVNGAPSNGIDEMNSLVSLPAPGDTFRVVMRQESSSHTFDCYINGELAGTLYDNAKLYSNDVYSGVMLLGAQSNKIDYFNLPRQDDVIAPNAVSDLDIAKTGATSVLLRFTASGDDGNTGTASGYDLRYSTSTITALNFSTATQVANEPTPKTAGQIDSILVTGLSPATTYYFALKVFDESPNFSLLSNNAPTTTLESNILTDNFNRTSLGTDWLADATLSIANGELHNTSSTGGWQDMAIFKPRANPIEVSFRYGTSVTNSGMESVGLLLMLDSPSLTASGYLAWVRPDNGSINLFTIIDGAPSDAVGSASLPSQYNPQPGSVFKIALSPGSANRFIYYIDDVEVGEIVDNNPGDLGTASMLYSGVLFDGNSNNNIDDFSVLNIGGQPTNLVIVQGNNQSAPVNETLPDSLIVRVTDNNSIAIENVLVDFKVKTGGGHVNLQSPDNNIRMEAEYATLSGSFVKASDATASGGSMVSTSGGDPLGGKASFTVYVQTAGNYVIWGRVKAKEGGYSYYSYFVQVDGLPANVAPGNDDGVWDFFPTTDAWSWDRVSNRLGGSEGSPGTDPVIYNLTAGNHTIAITQRYPSAILLDKILLAPQSSGYTPSGKEEVPQYITDANGIARATWTMGTVVGSNNSLEVTVPGYSVPAKTFNATVLPAPPTHMDKVAGGDGQSGVGGHELPTPFAVVLSDNYGNKVPGYEVTFTVTEGNGTLTGGVTTKKVVSDATGKASILLTLATDGASNKVTASFPNLTSLVFSATSTSGLAARLQKTTSGAISDTVNTMAETKLTARVLDSGGNPVVNHDVLFSLTQGTGSLLATNLPGETPAQTITTRSNANGYVGVYIKLGQQAGTYLVEVSSVKRGNISLTDSPFEYSIQAVADIATNMKYESGNNQTGAAGMPLSQPFVVKVVDQYNNGVSNYPVNYQVTQGSGSLTTSGPWYTDSNGLARATLILGEEANLTNKVLATADKNLPSPVEFVAIAGQVTSIERISSANPSGSANWPLDDSLKVRVLDNYGNPVGGYPVIWECYGDNKGTVNGETLITTYTTTNGISKVEYICGPEPGKISYAQAITDGLTGSPVTFTVSVADLEALQAITTGISSGTVGSPLAEPFKVKVVDQFGHGVKNYKVTFAVKEGDGKFNNSDSINVLTNDNNEAVATLTLGPIPGTENNVVEVSAKRKGKQLLTNGKMDDWLGINLTDWGQWVATNSAISRNLTSARSGSCVKITGTTDASYGFIYRASTIVVKASTKYKLSFWAKGTAGIKMFARVRATGDVFLQPDGSWAQTLANCIESSSLTDEFRLYTFEFTTRSDAKAFDGGNFRFYGQGNGSVYVDDISLLELTDEEVHLTNSPITFKASAVIGAADSLAAISGNLQNVVVGNQLPKPIVVKVTDKCGNGIAAYDVTFAVKAGGGFVDNHLINAIKPTDANGLAQVNWTVGSVKGDLNNILEVRANKTGVGQLRNSPFSFYASAKENDAFKIEKVSGDNPANKPVREKLTAPFIVKVSDQAGNGVSDHPVTFTVIEGSGTFNAADGDSMVTVTTGENGNASVYYYPGPKAGLRNVIQARSWNGSPELVGSPIQFTVTPVTGAVSPTASTIQAESPIPADGSTKSTITVTLTDSYGNAIADKSVTLQVDGSARVSDQPPAKSNSAGQVQGKILSTKAELVTVRAYVVDYQLWLTTTAKVRFTALAATNVVYVSGTNQSGNFETALQDMIRAKVVDRNGNGVYNHEVFFSVVQGGGLIYRANKTLLRDGDPVYTDSSGIASAYFILGKDQLNIAEATHPSLSGKAQFYAGADVGTATTLSIASGNNQVGTAGYTLVNPLVAKVTDSEADPIGNYPVTYEVTFGGGSINNKSKVSLTTNYFGEAPVYFTLGSEAGSNTIEASAEGLAGTPQYFFVTGNSGAAAKMVKKSGDGRTGTVGGTVSGISVQITDLNGNVYEGGYDVTFSVLEGDAEIVGDPEVSTGPDGIATTAIRLGTTIGQVVVQAYAPGLMVNNPVKFVINARAAAAVSMAIASGNNQDGTVGRELPYPFEVLVVDQYDNPVSGVAITFVRTGGNGTILTPQPVTTDENGIAATRLQLANNTGSYEVTAIRNGLPGSPLVFTATGVTNNFPLFNHIAEVTSPEGQIISFQVSATDADNDQIQYEARNLPSGASFDQNNRFNWTPNLRQAGEYKVRFIARDTKNGIDDETALITVTNSNQKPVLVSKYPNTSDVILGHKDVGERYDFRVDVTDADIDDEIIYEWHFDDLVVSTQSSYTLLVNDPMVNVGTHFVTVEITDGYDTISGGSWELAVVTPVELVTFAYEVLPRQGVVLSWQTGHEFNNSGFNVLRSNSISGPYEQINDDLIPSNTDGTYKFLDSHVKSGQMYFYKVADVSLSGTTTEHDIIKVLVSKPTEYELSQNYPNPFNPTTKINFQVPEQQWVTLKIYNIMGQEIATLVDEQREAGYHTAIWNGLDKNGNRATSGVYYYRIIAGSFVHTKKMVLMK